MAQPKYIQGDTAPQKITIATALAAAIGDLVGLISNTAVRAEDTTWDTNLATTQTAFSAGFVGVSMQAKTANVARVFGNSEDNVLVVATGGVWEFDCASATFEFGDLVGAAKQTGNALESQKVVAVASEALCVGRVVERGTLITRVKVKILSSLAPAAMQA